MNSSETEKKPTGEEPQEGVAEPPAEAAEAVEAETSQGAEDAADAAASEAEDTVQAEGAVEAEESGGSEEPEDPQAAIEQDLLRYKELAMRTAADLENFRKRAARDREESVRYANQALLEDLLPILDNFEMGMQAASQEQGSMIYIGMDMVRKQLNDFLSHQGVKEIEAEGSMFDPNLHDAVSQEEGEEEGRVLRVTRRGFMLRDRLLRPASVVVATATVAAAETESEPEGEG
jgi:molecular chaperone GrpE